MLYPLSYEGWGFGIVAQGLGPSASASAGLRRPP